MGVPKFFRYISERYPCLMESVKEHKIPAFDNLYLDMNGIIHMCSHPDDSNPHFRITEEKLFRDVFHYIEFLFRMIKPQKVFFLAIDGVAPRAKMNQQRGRRFRTAKDAEKAEMEAKKKGEKLPETARFDSNCITPGTVFMKNLHDQLKYFVVHKISTDKTWSKCKIILSGHETPGEGEHKIMDYIRYIRAQPGYDPNTRHCLYGLDADLIMLGLCTHDPHFSLLREEVKFGRKDTKRIHIPEEIRFYLLHLSLMREYLELEFYSLKNKLVGFEFDIERIIDDWVLMGFLVGNDFIPHLPNLHIANDALQVLYKAYIEILPSLDGYINESGTLNLKRFEKFMEQLGSIDLDNFEEARDDLLYMEGKTGRKQDAHLPVSTKPRTDDGEESPEEPLMDPSLAALIKNTEDMYLDSSEDDECDTNNEDWAFKNYKDQYYRNKLEYHKVTKEVMRDQAEGYVKAIQWNLNYYYNGVCSWSWYYPHHYSPYISDIKGFSDLKIEFELGEPFRPYEQLLAVLPVASKNLLPKCYHHLMTDDNSIIKQYYPEDFQTDLNGKRQEWEAVVLVPFIDEKNLLEAMKECNEQLLPEEAKRNCHGPMLVYIYTDEDLGKYEAPNYFPTVSPNNALCTLLTIEDVRVPKEKLVKGAYPGAKFDIFYPGFPTMKHLKFKGILKKAKVKLFEQPSRNENMILKVLHNDENNDDSNWQNLLGKTIFVGWPHLIEAKIVAISNVKTIHKISSDGKIKCEDNVMSLFGSQCDGIIEYHMNRLGIDFGQIKVIVHVRVLIGRRYIFSANGRINLEKQYAVIDSNYPLQGIVRDINVYDECYSSFREITDVYPEGSSCFVLTNPYYGSMGTILDSKECLKDNRLKVCLEVIVEPDFTKVRQIDENMKRNYISLYNSASQLAISNYVFSRITGSIFITVNNNEGGLKTVNVGLDLKFNKKNQETPGYTKKNGSIWFYTRKAIELVKSYIVEFPEVIEFLSRNNNMDELDAVEIYGDDADEKVKKIQVWLKSLPTHNIERRICNSSVLEVELIEAIEEVVDNLEYKEPKRVTMQIKPQLLYKPEIQTGNIPPDSTVRTEVFDRIVHVTEGATVPLGAKGTVIAVHKTTNVLTSDNDIYDVVFDRKFTGGMALNCSEGRGYRLSKNSFINLSYGARVMEQKTGKPGELLALAKANQNTNNFKNNSAFASFNTGQQRMPVLYNYYSHNKQMPFMHPPEPNQTYQSRQGQSYPLGRNPPSYPPRPSQSFPQTMCIQRPPFVPNKPFDFMPSYAVKQNSQKQGGRSQNPTQSAKPEELNDSVDTDLLKKILKIPTNTDNNNSINNTSNGEVKPKNTIISQVFTSSQFQSEKPKPPQKNCPVQSPSEGSSAIHSSATTNLLHFYQAHGLGCPRYFYFDNRAGCTYAQLTLPSRRVLVGKEAKTREEASENVAVEALNILNNPPKTKPDRIKEPTGFPVPPQKWVQFNQNHANKNQHQVKTNQNNKQNNQAGNTSPKKTSQLKDQIAGTSKNNFVPLQAIIKRATNKNAHNANKNSSTSRTNSSKNHEDSQIRNNKAKSSDEKCENNQQNKKSTPRRTRIAANFVSKT